VKRILIALLILGALGAASAQGFRVNGGFDLQPLTPSFNAVVTVERPSFDLFGVRWGPVATFKLQTDFTDVSAQLLTGMGGAIVLPDANWAIKVKLLVNTELQTGVPLTVGPDFQVAFSKTF